MYVCMYVYIIRKLSKRCSSPYSKVPVRLLIAKEDAAWIVGKRGSVFHLPEHSGGPVDELEVTRGLNTGGEEGWGVGWIPNP